MKELIFRMFSDSAVLNYKRIKKFPPDILYCGSAYSFICCDKLDTTIINYTPMNEADEIFKLHRLFWEILQKPIALSKSQIDTISIGKFLESYGSKNSSPPPEMPASVEYIPPRHNE